VVYVSWHSTEDGSPEPGYRFHVGAGMGGPVCGERSEPAGADEYGGAFRLLLGDDDGDGGIWCPHCMVWLGEYLTEGDPPRPWNT